MGNNVITKGGHLDLLVVFCYYGEYEDNKQTRKHAASYS